MSWDSITKNLFLKDDILIAGHNAQISYPPEGHDVCFNVEDQSFWFEHRARCICETVRNFPADGMIFDVGGGNGHVSLAMERNGYQTALVEPGISGILNARKRGLKRLICATTDTAGFPKASLPAIGIFDVLEHIQEDEKFIISLKVMLKSGGRLYITVPAYCWLWSQEDVHAGHFRRYTLEGLRKQLEQLGFEIDYSSYIFSFLPPLIWIFRVIPHQLGVKNKPQHSDTARDHVVQHRFLKWFLNKISRFETAFIRDKKRIRFGSSCLVVARVKE